MPDTGDVDARVLLVSVEQADGGVAIVEDQGGPDQRRLMLDDGCHRQRVQVVEGAHPVNRHVEEDIQADDGCARCRKGRHVQHAGRIVRHLLDHTDAREIRAQRERHGRAVTQDRARQVHLRHADAHVIEVVAVAVVGVAFEGTIHVHLDLGRPSQEDIDLSHRGDIEMEYRTSVREEVNLYECFSRDQPSVVRVVVLAGGECEDGSGAGGLIGVTVDHVVGALIRRRKDEAGRQVSKREEVIAGGESAKAVQPVAGSGRRARRRAAGMEQVDRHPVDARLAVFLDAVAVGILPNHVAHRRRVGLNRMIAEVDAGNGLVRVDDHNVGAVHGRAVEQGVVDQQSGVNVGVAAVYHPDAEREHTGGCERVAEGCEAGFQVENRRR